MPLASTEFENKSLDANYGDDHGTDWPDTFTVHLYDGDPRDDGVEISGTDYAAVTINNDSTRWPDATGGKKVSTLVNFGTAGSDWPTARWWVLKDPSDDGLVECGQFESPLDPSSGTGVHVRLSISYDSEAI